MAQEKVTMHRCDCGLWAMPMTLAARSSNSGDEHAPFGAVDVELLVQCPSCFAYHTLRLVDGVWSPTTGAVPHAVST